MAVQDPIAYVLRVARRIAKEGSILSPSPETYGVMFDVPNARAYIMSHHFIGRIGNIGPFTALNNTQTRTFYDFSKEAWTTNQFPMEVARMSERMKVPTLHSLYLPIYQTLRDIKNKYDTFIHRRDVTAVVDVSLGPSKEQIDMIDSTEEMLLTFVTFGGAPVAQHASVPKLIRVEEYSKIPASRIKEGRYYHARAMRQDDESVFVSVQHEMFVGQRIGLWEKKNQLFTDKSQMLDMNSYPEQNILRYPVIRQQVEYGDYRPVLLTGSYFYEALLLMQYFQYVEINSRYAEEDVVIKALKPANDWPDIEIMMGQYKKDRT